LRFESVDFDSIPGQSKLFTQYQKDPLTLRKFYPSAVASHVELSSRGDAVLSNYSVDRGQLCDILADQNQNFLAGSKTFENIQLLRNSDTLAVLTGQQTGLFTGPLYTIYKALSTIRLVECLRNRGISAVPIFWAATEDHDFEEISHASMISSAGEEISIQLDVAEEFRGRPVGSIPIPETLSISALDQLPQTEFEREVVAKVAESWKPGRKIGEAFCAQIQSILSNYGIIVVDPLDSRIKTLAAPMYRRAVEKVDEIVPALVVRSKELESAGYHAQVLVTPDYFPLFYHTDDGVRRALKKVRDAKYRVSDTSIEFTTDELSEIATTDPDRFSPGVMLRPVVQDFLFPTLCYFGGGAEIAYFAQNSEVYRILERPVTPILHRQSFTVVEAKHARTIEKYDLSFADLFSGFDKLLPKIVEEFVNPSSSRLFADAEDKINIELNRLDQDISKIDPTLGDNLGNRRRKILYHIAALRKKFHRAQIERDEIVNRQLNSLFASVMPEGQLQERVLNVESFRARYGGYFIDWLYDSIDLDERGHRVLYL
jgi:bacillithiol biosynthesis cysteine-adding enzyme BshC